jgi:hypothetical protein
MFALNTHRTMLMTVVLRSRINKPPYIAHEYNLHGCDHEQRDQAELAGQRQLQTPEHWDRKRDDDRVGNNVGHIRSDDEVSEIEACRSQNRLVPGSLDWVALEDGREEDGDAPGDDKSHHAVAHLDEHLVDLEEA